MNESQLKLLLEAGAIKGMTIVGQGSHLHLEVKTQGGSKVLLTGKGEIRQWVTLDACGKWLRKLGIGQANLQMDQWQPDQKGLAF